MNRLFERVRRGGIHEENIRAARTAEDIVEDTDPRAPALCFGYYDALHITLALSAQVTGAVNQGGYGRAGA